MALQSQRAEWIPVATTRPRCTCMYAYVRKRDVITHWRERRGYEAHTSHHDTSRKHLSATGLCDVTSSKPWRLSSKVNTYRRLHWCRHRTSVSLSVTAPRRLEAVGVKQKTALVGRAKQYIFLYFLLLTVIFNVLCEIFLTCKPFTCMTCWDTYFLYDVSAAVTNVYTRHCV